MVGAIEGYIIGIGRLNTLMRVISGISAALLFIPNSYLGMPIWMNCIGLILFICMFPLRSVSLFKWNPVKEEKILSA